MADPLLTRDFFAYTSDDTNTYQIATTIANGNANSASGVAPGVNPSYPRGWVPRKVYGVSSAGARTKLPIFDPGNAIWVGGGTTFTKNAVSYNVEGRIGEKRTNKGG